MSNLKGVIDEQPYFPQRDKRPAEIQANFMPYVKKLREDQMLIIGIANVDGTWDPQMIHYCGPEHGIEFFSWFTTNRHLIRGDDTYGLPAEACYVMLTIDMDTFDASDPAHEVQAIPELKGFYSTLREMQRESMAAE